MPAWLLAEPIPASHSESAKNLPARHSRRRRQLGAVNQWSDRLSAKKAHARVHRQSLAPTGERPFNKRH